MLVPAVVYRNEIIKYSDTLRYSTKMMYFNGCIETGQMQIQTDPTEGRYQWAVVDRDKNLVGYIGYAVDYFSRCIYGFGLISFVDDKKTMACGVISAIHHIMSLNPHRVEWRCVGDNPAMIGYQKIVDRFTKNNKFIKFIYPLHDIFKDAQGNYHDCCIFELLETGG